MRSTTSIESDTKSMRDRSESIDTDETDKIDEIEGKETQLPKE